VTQAELLPGSFNQVRKFFSEYVIILYIFHGRTSSHLISEVLHKELYYLILSLTTSTTVSQSTGNTYVSYKYYLSDRIIRQHSDIC
jgi:hypothetical protein